MAAAVNRVVELNGGIVVWDGGGVAAEVPGHRLIDERRGRHCTGYLADFAIIDNFDDFNAEMVFRHADVQQRRGA